MHRFRYAFEFKTFKLIAFLLFVFPYVNTLASKWCQEHCWFVIKWVIFFFTPRIVFQENLNILHVWVMKYDSIISAISRYLKHVQHVSVGRTTDIKGLAGLHISLFILSLFCRMKNIQTLNWTTQNIATDIKFEKWRSK